MNLKGESDAISALNYETGCGISDSLSVDTFFPFSKHDAIAAKLVQKN